MKTIFRRTKRNDADLLAFETAVELLKPKWRRMQEDALDKSTNEQQQVYQQMKQEFDGLRRTHGITAEIHPLIFKFKIKDTAEQQNKINQDLMKNIRADGLLVPFNGTTVRELEKWITQTLTMLKTIALTEERIPLTMKIAKNYLNKLIPDGNRFDNIMKRAWTDKNDDIEQIFTKMIHILHSTGIAENEKCKLDAPVQGQNESILNYSKRFEEYNRQLEGTDEFNRIIHADTISTRIYVLLLKGLNKFVKKYFPIPGLQKMKYEEVIEKLTEIENTALIFEDDNQVNAIHTPRQFNKEFFNKKKKKLTN
uniref:Retrotransposon gag domain-containing protein n=1 Tax=Strongyloides venezuelensis TaxID=75913 RepID=A0A0K0EYP9_STRVS